MKRLMTGKAQAALVVAVIGALISWYSQRDGEKSLPRPSNDGPAATHAPDTRSGRPATRPAADFDFYLLALSIHAAFCADGHDRKTECRTGSWRPLVIHGLWPEKLKSGAYPRDCPAPALHLDTALERELADYMPGMASDLHDHEWRTHGSCSGLDDDEYFRRTLYLARDLDAALRTKLTTLSGGETTAAELRAAADSFRAGLGNTFTLHCRTLRDAPQSMRSRPYLIEVRQCVDNDGPDGEPGTLLDCASVNRRDQGCGAAFRIAEQRR